MNHKWAFHVTGEGSLHNGIIYTSKKEGKSKIMVSSNDILIHTIFTHSKYHPHTQYGNPKNSPPNPNIKSNACLLKLREVCFCIFWVYFDFWTCAALKALKFLSLSTKFPPRLRRKRRETTQVVEKCRTILCGHLSAQLWIELLGVLESVICHIEWWKFRLKFTNIAYISLCKRKSKNI
jgi:hypothetical protein